MSHTAGTARPTGAVHTLRRAPDEPAARLGDRSPTATHGPASSANNSVVPQQAAYAVSLLLADLAALTAAECPESGQEANTA
jgi:hypothetical protein